MHPKTLVLDHAAGCPAAVQIDLQLQTDREWFAAHPRAGHYYRDLLPGDLGLSTLECIIRGDDLRPRVRVALTDRPGLRTKEFIDVAFCLPGLDGEYVASLFAHATEVATPTGFHVVGGAR